MKIDITILISVVSLSIAAIVCFTTMVRNNKKDNKDDSAQLTTVIVKLESIGEGISEIKADLRNVKTEIQELRERVAVLENSRMV